MILQISRIQQRRGLQENLPTQLASGEIGWSVDTRKLYIGNGTLAEGSPEAGNTEILTEFSNFFSIAGTFIYEGNAAGYEVQTGPSSTRVAARSMQDKLDDVVNLRDFHFGDITKLGDGAIHGDHCIPTDQTENPVVIINRAIEQLYRASLVATNHRTRRTLIIPAGKYMLYGDFIRMKPYVTLRGDGIDSTIIVQADPTQPCVMSSCDLRNVTGFTYTNASNVTVSTTDFTDTTSPGSNYVSDLTLQAGVECNSLYLDSVNNTTFDNVRFDGIISSPLLSNTCSCVRIGEHLKSSVVLFNNCKFSNQNNVISITNRAENITIQNSTISSVYRGIRIDSTEPTTVTGIRIINNVFDNVSAEAIFSNSTNNVVSSYNTFNTVGDIANSHVINFGGNSCYSIGDTFTRMYNAPVAPIQLNGKGSFATLSNGKLMLGNSVSLAGYVVPLLNDSATPQQAGVIGYGTNPTLVEYSVLRDTEQRTGKMKVANNGIEVVYEDDYIETASIGIKLIPILSGGQLILTYTTTSDMGMSSTLSVSSKTLI